MNATLTTTLAILGAILGSLSFAWNVWTWLRGRPRIVAKVELCEGPHEPIIFYEIRNRGDKPTTVEEIKLVKYKDSPWGLLGFFEHFENVSVKYRESAKLPVRLGPGDVWKGCSAIHEEMGFPSMDKLGLINRGRLHYKIQCAHTDRLVSGKVKAENLFIRL